ncbi:MAG: T9SS type A sorting domain-containing protein [Syntrophothermus sp.]
MQKTKMYEKDLEKSTTIDVRELPAGLYMLKLVREKEVLIGKFIKQ